MAKTKAKGGSLKPAPVYTGPDYLRSIRIPDSKMGINPREFTAEEVEAFIAKHPKYQTWWSTPETEQSEANHSESE